MPNIVRANLGRIILIGATLALSIGASTAAFAQPGSSFQTRGERESDGNPALPSTYSITKHPPEAYQEWDGRTPPGYAWYPYGGSDHHVRYDQLNPRPSPKTPESWNYAQPHR
jgi:opacity protein-like surface antigen